MLYKYKLSILSAVADIRLLPSSMCGKEDAEQECAASQTRHFPVLLGNPVTKIKGFLVLFFEVLKLQVGFSKAEHG